MEFKHIGLIAIGAICVAVLLALLNFYTVLIIPALVLNISWLLVAISLILYFKYKSLWFVAGFIFLLSVLIISLRYKSVQTYVAHKVASYFSGELKTRIEIGSLYIKPFKSLVLEGFYVQDLEGDTLISSPRFTVDLNLLSLQLRKISVQTLQMDNGKFYIKQYKDSTTNLEFIVNYFNTGKTNPAKKVRRPYDITFDKIILNNIAFKYQNFNVPPKAGNSINFNDLYLARLNTTIVNLDTKTHLAKAEIKNLTFHEKSGFYLKNLSADATIDTNKMEFKDLILETPNTLLTDYVSMSYNRFGDFGHFLSKIYIKAHFNNSHLDPRDISYFNANVKKIDMKIGLNGDISGYVNNIKARKFSVKAGKDTYFTGDFDIKGLPVIDETFLSLKFDQIYTNKQDADYIIKTFTGKVNQIPAIVQKFGNINFKGQFTGFPKDFIAHGEFKTALGRLVTDINMKISGKVPVYSGTLKTYDFNIAELSGRKDLGRITMTTTVNGSGFSTRQIKETLISNITSLDFKGYKYSNIKLNGIFNQNLFDGKITVNDPNLKLDFNGSVNLIPKIPEFNFVASIKSANLHALKLTKDTVSLDADLNTNFTGTDIDNIQGTLSLKKVRLTNPKTSLVVDSLELFAKGIGSDRSLGIKSDILDASIQGQYDLKTLPSYFISVAKKYIPSLNAKNVTTGVQNFELKLKLKYFEPVGLLLMPDLKIPEGATINGKFVSADNTTSINGFAKLIQYKNVKITDFILDESNDDKALNVFATSNRISFNDSLYVQNINISNVIRNDSLALNVKLSDKDAANQLDLNGLVEFSRDTTMKLSLLPSDVVINREAWKIQEQVRIKFEQGKTIIENFELFRDNQLLTINGIISPDPQDKIKLEFKQFKLATFNALTKGFGATMKGELNGNVSVASINKTPRIESGMTIDSMAFNNTLIGNLKLDADMDNATKLVNVEMHILKKDEETLKLKGTYNANVDDNNLDMAITMNNSEVIIFEPFLKRLVSNLQGKVSADARLTGKLTNPLINGKLSFNEAGMTVNYLKTPYRITDSVAIENSIIKINSLIIRDPKNNQAVVNGSVDMNNPMVPIINIGIVPTRFLALNTTSKDNSLYYGTAYASGFFEFIGPTNNMRINIDAQTEAGTVFNIPLNASETIVDNDFITFVAKDSTSTKRKQISFKGLTMNFDLDIDENTEVNIFTDLGKLSGRGDAQRLNLKISSLGDFAMTGDYIISKGKFVFTAQDFINKIFDISQGGSIRWTGNPSGATINLRAAYSARTSLSPLYNAAGRPPIDTRVLAEAIMILSGPLLKPDIAFDLNFPADSYVKDEIQSYLSDVNNVTQQAFSLIVRRSFSSGSGIAGISEQLNSTVLSAGTEFAFNQLNNILAQSLNLKLVDINIRSFNDASASLRLLNERLILTGGVTDQRAKLNDLRVLGGSDVARDLEARYLLKRDQSLTLTASNRLNNRNFLNPDQEYISAIGLVYKQDFDNFGEFLRIITGKKNRDEKKKEEPAPPVLTPAPSVSPPSAAPSSPIALKPAE
jgi:hypothetical protein